jgi:hypothetical protein
MARPKRQSLIRRRGSTYQYDFTIKLAEGGLRRCRGSLNETDETEAERKAAVIKRGLEREQELTYLESTGVIEKRDTRQDVTLVQALERYMREVGNAASSSESMQSYNNRLLAHFGKARMLSSVDGNAVLGFREYLSTLTKRVQGGTAPLSPRTKNAHLNHLRFVLSRARTLWNCKVQTIKWGGDKGVLLRQPKKPQQVIQTSGIDFPTLIAAVPEDLLPIFCFSLVSAVRQRDAYGLRKEQVQWSMGRILIMQKSKTPGGEPHYVPITPEIDGLLRECWYHHPEFVFTYVCRRSRHESEGERRERPGPTLSLEQGTASRTLGRSENKARAQGSQLAPHSRLGGDALPRQRHARSSGDGDNRTQGHQELPPLCRVLGCVRSGGIGDGGQPHPR